MDSSTQNLHINESVDLDESVEGLEIPGDSRTCPAVDVRDAWLTYGGEDDAPGLRGATLTVDRGRICALLGPSGCGKTTLISTVVGLRTPQTGEVKVFGYSPGSIKCGAPGSWIGFMPQETCLLPELTIEETLEFYSTLNCVPKTTRKINVERLIRILELPKGRFVHQLSGGQQRRLSLAASLVHDPPLVILDEPTVGVDPLLRNAIWRYLTHLANDKGKTVILSTHYVEEARAADKVALMRLGRILVQESPTVLMNRYSESSLETVFLRICTEEQLALKRHGETGKQCCYNNDLEPSDEDEETDKRCSNIHSQNLPSLQSSSCSALPNTQSLNLNVSKIQELKSCSASKYELFSPLPNTRRSFTDTMRVIFGLCWKDQCLLRRNILFLVLAFVTPMVNFFLIRLYFGHLPVGLHVFLVGDKRETLAKSFLSNHFERMALNVAHSENLEDAIDTLRLGKTNAVIHIPDEYTLNILKRIRLGLAADNETIHKSQLRIYLDNTNMVLGTTVYVSVLKSILNMVTDTTKILGSDEMNARLPLHFAEPIFGKLDIELTHSIMLGEIPQSLFTTGLFIAVMTFVRDRENRLLQRLKACGLGPFEIMASHFVLHTGLLLVQIVSLLSALVGLQVEIRGSYILLITLMSLASYVGTALGMTMSILASQIYVAVLLASLVQFATIGMAGIFWPVEGSPKLFYMFSNIHPMLHIVRALRLVINNGTGLESFNVWFSLPYSVFIMLVLTLIAAFIYNGNKLEIIESILAFKKPNINLPWGNKKHPTISKQRLSKQ